MWKWLVDKLVTGNSGKSAIEQVGDFAIDMREVFKGKEVDPNLMLEYNIKVMQLKTSIVANDQNGNWLQRSWRPLFALTLVFIFLNNTVLVTYFNFANPINLNEHVAYLEQITYAIAGIYGLREVSKLSKTINVSKALTNILKKK